MTQITNLSSLLLQLCIVYIYSVTTFYLTSFFLIAFYTNYIHEEGSRLGGSKRCDKNLQNTKKEFSCRKKAYNFQIFQTMKICIFYSTLFLSHQSLPIQSQLM